MGMKYREKFHEVQSELHELQEKTTAEKHIQDKLFQLSMVDIEHMKNREISELEHELKAKDDQIYDQTQYCLI